MKFPTPIRWLIAGLILALAGCVWGGGGSYEDGSRIYPVTYTVGGTITGLTASGLVLTNTSVGASDTASPASGATNFTFSFQQASGSTYDVVVTTQPAGLTCTVSNASGTVSSANITSVVVTCTGNFTESVLYSFVGQTGSDGAAPQAALIQGSDGNFYGTTSSGGTNNEGTVFQITTAGAETDLHSFGSGSDGQTPQAALVQGSDGNFYGTTDAGGTKGKGTVFKITPTGVETVLYSFGSANDGAYPQAGLIQASDGNFYGTSAFGGTNGDGTVFKITPAGVETVLHSFGNGGDGIEPVAGVIQASDGNFYGTTESGGANNSGGTAFKVTPGGVETVLYSFRNFNGDGIEPFAGLIQGSDGNFYGTTALGGMNVYGTVFKLTPAGVETVLHSFANGNNNDGQHPRALIEGSDGNFYGTTQDGGTNNKGTVFQITAAGAETVLHSFGSGGDGQNPEAGLLQGSDGNFYGTTQNGGANGDGTVFKLAPP